MTHAEDELLPQFMKSINEAESIEDVKKALVDSMPGSVHQDVARSEEQGGGCCNALTRGALARKAEGAESI